MSDFALTWDLVRNRLIASYQDLDTAQLNFRVYPGTLTIGEMAVHVYGTEVKFISDLLKTDLDDFGQRLKAAATDGVVNDEPVPFGPSEIDQDLIARAEEYARAMVEPVIHNLTDEVRATQIVSVLGPVIDGSGAMARLAYHPAYHHAQSYMIQQSPHFPR